MLCLVPRTGGRPGCTDNPHRNVFHPLPPLPSPQQPPSQSSPLGILPPSWLECFPSMAAWTLGPGGHLPFWLLLLGVVLAGAELSSGHAIAGWDPWSCTPFPKGCNPLRFPLPETLTPASSLRGSCSSSAVPPCSRLLSPPSLNAFCGCHCCFPLLAPI